MARKRKAELGGHGSDDDASYQPKKKSKPQDDEDDDDWKPVKKGRGKGKDKNKKQHCDIITDDMEYVDQLGNGPIRTHNTSLHVIAHPEPRREALLKWYEGVHASRGMPWRKPYDHSWNSEQKAQRAYEVWISEIMLQQTQVATVIPYYNNWMQRFPTIKDLADSDIDVVNGLWKGLGYYSRAARLLSGAHKAMEEFGGRLPDNAQDMESKIPGIGRYSAGAICSIAYNQCVPVLDGNVHRLLSRLLALHALPKARQTLDILWSAANAFVKDAHHPGDVNQALIELGSTVCKVREPSCSACPLQRWCAAYEHQDQGEEEDKDAKHAMSTAVGDHSLPDIEELCSLCEPLAAGSLVTAYPMKVERKKSREELDIVNVIEWRIEAGGPRYVLLVRRPQGGLLGGLHEFPTAPNVPVTTSSSAQIEIAHMLLSALLVAPPAQPSCQTSAPSDSRARPRAAQRPTDNPGALRIEKIVPAGDVLHIFSHIKKTYRVQWVLLEGGTSDAPPSLVRSPEGEVFGTAQPPTSVNTKLRKGLRRGETAANRTGKSQGTTIPASGPTTQWVLLDSVANANIGTGVLKIWRQVCALWKDAECD